jgi:hypothetical protein
MLLDADCVFFQKEIVYKLFFFYKLNADYALYLAVMDEMTSANLSLLWILVATGG